MTIKVGIVMDPIEAIHFKKDTSLALLWAAQRKGWQLYYMEPSDLSIHQGEAMARMASLEVAMNPESWFNKGEYKQRALADLDVILMRQDPPFDSVFLYATQILALAEKQGTLVVNATQAVRDCNEKLFATHFPSCCPPVLVSCLSEELRAFHQQHQDVIFKPLDGMGGTSIYRVKEDGLNLGVILEALTLKGKRPCMVQKYLPEIQAGDKRILMIMGEPVPYALARIPSAGETRGNLAAGGRGVGQPLSERDRWICQQVGPVLKEKGLYFVGLDVIGDYLTEINVTSPTCIRELDQQFSIDIGMQLMDALQPLITT